MSSGPGGPGLPSPSRARQAQARPGVRSGHTLRRADHRNGIPRPVPLPPQGGRRAGWLSDAALGAGDGLVCTASLVVGMAAAGSSPAVVMLSGVAGLAAGAMAKAARDHASVQALADAERAALRREQSDLRARPAASLRDLAATFVARGVDETLATAVAEQLTAHDALAAHASADLGLPARTRVWPLRAALVSGASFAVGAALPLLALSLAPPHLLLHLVMASTLAGLAVLGSVAAEGGGARPFPAALRATFWGAMAMGVTSMVGAWFGAAP